MFYEAGMPPPASDLAKKTVLAATGCNWLELASNGIELASNGIQLASNGIELAPNGIEPGINGR